MKTYYARVDRIQYRGKIWGLGEPVVVDDKEEMPEKLWESQEEREQAIAEYNKAQKELSVEGKDEKIRSLMEQLKDAKTLINELEKDNKALHKKVEELKKAKPADEK